MKASPRLALSPAIALFLSVALLAISAPPAARAYTYDPEVAVNVPMGIDHAPFDRLLRKYVNEVGLVDYAGWKASTDDFDALNRYLGQYAGKGSPAKGDERIASLVNGYNAFVIQWILRNYPIKSVWRTKEPFDGKRNVVNGEKVSLNQIEQESLIPLIGWKTHSVLVCAARSCPPLRNRAYRGSRIEEQIASAYRVWFARKDLTEFLPKKNRAEISSIFKWYAGDFAKAKGGARGVLLEFAPTQYRDFLRGNDYAIKYKSYHWGLNDQGKEGRNYSKIELLWDNLF